MALACFYFPCMKVKVCDLLPFRLGHLLKSKIESESNFLIKSYIDTIIKKIGVFWSIFKKSQKMDFPLYFEKLIWLGGDIFFEEFFF